MGNYSIVMNLPPNQIINLNYIYETVIPTVREYLWNPTSDEDSSKEAMVLPAEVSYHFNGQLSCISKGPNEATNEVAFTDTGSKSLPRITLKWSQTSQFKRIDPEANLYFK